MPRKPIKSPFGGKLLTAHETSKQGSKAVWEGPCGTGPKGGVTQSLLGKFLACRERFRLYAIEGLRPTRRWEHKTGYGDMWHVCEEYCHLPRVHHFGRWMERWEAELEDHAEEQCRLYPMQQAEIEHWFMVCRVQFPVYVDFWAKNEHVVNRKPLMQEECFDVPYKLPNGKVVRLRGKWDSVDLVTSGEDKGVWLQENKSKGNPDELKIRRQLRCDLQSMLYLTALRQTQEKGALTTVTISGPSERVGGLTIIREGKRVEEPIPIRGIRYNVARRPLSGGKGTIIQRQPTEGSKCPRCKGEGVKFDKKAGADVRCHKCFGKGRVNAKPGETREEFYARVASYIKAEPHEFFMRWNVEVFPSDLERFKQQVLTPTLMQLVEWYDWVSSPEGMKNPFGKSIHFRFPYGAYNPAMEDRIGDYDYAMDDDNMSSLTKSNDLFSELV